jgi:outer membrane protein TolC
MRRRLAIVLTLVAMQVAPASAERRRTARAPGDTESERDRDDEDATRAESIGIDDLIGAAVRRSPDLKRVRALRKAARELVSAAALPDQWRVAGSVDYTAGTTARTPGQPVQQIGQSNLTTELGASKTLPTGGALSITVSESKLYQRFAVAQDTANAGTSTDAIAEGVGHVAVAQVAVVQPLVRGRGIAVARAARHRNEITSKRAEVQALYDAQILIGQLVGDYWEVAYASEVIQVRKDSLRSAREQLEIAKDIFRAGMLPASSLKAAEYAVAVREEALLRAQVDLEDRSLSARQRAGLEVGPHDIGLVPTDPFVLDDNDFQLDDLLGRARDDNARLAAARLGVKLAQVDLVVAEDAVMPAVDFRASASAVGGGNDFMTAVERAGSAQAYEIRAGVSVAYEIGGAAAAGHRATRELHAAAELDAEIVERDVVASVVRAVHNVRRARKRVEVAAKAIEVATLILKAEQASFKAGRQTAYIVFERQAEVDEARLLRARAIADYHQAVALVEIETGQILETWGVELREKRK